MGREEAQGQAILEMGRETQVTGKACHRLHCGLRSPCVKETLLSSLSGLQCTLPTAHIHCRASAKISGGSAGWRPKQKEGKVRVRRYKTGGIGKRSLNVLMYCARDTEGRGRRWRRKMSVSSKQSDLQDDVVH